MNTLLNNSLNNLVNNQSASGIAIFIAGLGAMIWVNFTAAGLIGGTNWKQIQIDVNKTNEANIFHSI